MLTSRCAALRLALALALVSYASAEATWIEALDKASGKKFYYNQETRESAWEAPQGVEIKYLGEEGSSASSTPSKSGGNASGSTILMILLTPMLLLFGGLGVLYFQASQEGLSDMLKSMKKKRDRSAKRRGTSSGGKFKQRAKLSQDGKGGRSANS